MSSIITDNRFNYLNDEDEVVVDLQAPQASEASGAVPPCDLDWTGKIKPLDPFAVLQGQRRVAAEIALFQANEKASQPPQQQKQPANQQAMQGEKKSAVETSNNKSKSSGQKRRERQAKRKAQEQEAAAKKSAVPGSAEYLTLRGEVEQTKKRLLTAAEQQQLDDYNRAEAEAKEQVEAKEKQMPPAHKTFTDQLLYNSQFKNYHELLKLPQDLETLSGKFKTHGDLLSHVQQLDDAEEPEAVTAIGETSGGADDKKDDDANAVKDAIRLALTKLIVGTTVEDVDDTVVWDTNLLDNLGAISFVMNLRYQNVAPKTADGWFDGIDTKTLQPLPVSMHDFATIPHSIRHRYLRAFFLRYMRNYHQALMRTSECANMLAWAAKNLLDSGEQKDKVSEEIPRIVSMLDGFLHAYRRYGVEVPKYADQKKDSWPSYPSIELSLPSHSLVITIKRVSAEALRDEDSDEVSELAMDGHPDVDNFFQYASDSTKSWVLMSCEKLDSKDKNKVLERYNGATVIGNMLYKVGFDYTSKALREIRDPSENRYLIKRKLIAALQSMLEKGWVLRARACRS